ncbi:ATP-binding protein [Yoonia sp. GPGPB17]|uniref:ATP-binding protein n=1 Tax=Yoonia sp. GPGPB17 TaxID=3026147 RepID=UPI0030BE3F6F
MTLTHSGPYPSFLNFVESLTSHDPVSNFPLDRFIKHFGADNGSFWLRDATAPKELILRDTFRRPDLERVGSKISISATGSTFHEAMQKKSFDHFLLAECGDPALRNWRLELEEIGLTPQTGSILFLPFVPKNEAGLIGAVIMHSQAGFAHAALEVNQIIHLVRTAANVTHIALNGQQKSLRERHKIGHEVSRQINDAKRRVSEIESTIRGRRSMNSTDALRTLNDAISGLVSAGETVEQGTFTEAVSNRAKNCRFIDFRDVFLETSHLALADHPIDQVIFNSLNAPIGLSVRMDHTDLTLLLSNLISNAAKYSVLRGDITCRWNDQGDMHALVISNNSDPLDEQHLEMMWRFGHRGPNAIDVKGRGVGLSVVSDICDVYGLRPHAGQSVSGSVTRTNLRIQFPGEMTRMTYAGFS